MFALDRSYRSGAGDPDAQENSDGVSARSVAVPSSGS